MNFLSSRDMQFQKSRTSQIWISIFLGILLSFVLTMAYEVFSSRNLVSDMLLLSNYSSYSGAPDGKIRKYCDFWNPGDCAEQIEFGAFDKETIINYYLKVLPQFGWKYSPLGISGFHGGSSGLSTDYLVFWKKDEGRMLTFLYMESWKMNSYKLLEVTRK